MVALTVEDTKIQVSNKRSQPLWTTLESARFRKPRSLSSKKLQTQPKNTQNHQKKPKTEQNSDEKPPLSITFIGNLDQPFQLNDTKNKQYLRTKLEQAAPQCRVGGPQWRIMVNNGE